MTKTVNRLQLLVRIFQKLSMADKKGLTKYLEREY